MSVTGWVHTCEGIDLTHKNLLEDGLDAIALGPCLTRQ